MSCLPSITPLPYTTLCRSFRQSLLDSHAFILWLSYKFFRLLLGKLLLRVLELLPERLRISEVAHFQRSAWNRLIQNGRSEEHTSELQSLTNIVCSILLQNK